MVWWCVRCEYFLVSRFWFLVAEGEAQRLRRIGGFLCVERRVCMLLVSKYLPSGTAQNGARKNAMRRRIWGGLPGSGGNRAGHRLEINMRWERLEWLGGGKLLVGQRRKTDRWREWIQCLDDASLLLFARALAHTATRRC